MTVRGEAGYPEDQVPRRLAYEATHPDVEIACLGAYWRAVIPGRPAITRVTLKDLLDALEALD